jgi:hypothetical protein
MLNESSTVTACGPSAWWSISVRPRHGRISASAAGGQVAAVELGADLHGQRAAAQRGMAARAVRGGLGKVAAQTDKHFGLTIEHGVDRLDGVVALCARHLEVKALLQRIEKGR